jgi:hypothetical protein
MSGQLRRPPQLWEQRLARTTSILGAGISSSGDATAIVPPSSPPGAGGGTEPAPVTPPPGDFIAPSQPTLIGSVQGINVVWNGLNSAGDLWPSDTSYVEVHMDTSGTATLGTATLKGRLARPGGLAVTGLSAGTTYYFRLRGADPAGNFTAAGTAASGTPGLINAPDIAANAINANTIVAGTITGWDINSAYLSGGTVSGGFITGGTVSGGFITGGTVTGSVVQSSSGASRIVLNTGDTLDFYSSSVKRGDLYGVTVSGLNGIGVTGAMDVSSKLFCDSLQSANAATIKGALFAEDAIAGTPSTSVPNVRINTTTGEIRETTHANSSQRFKHDIIPLDDTDLGGDVDTTLLGDSVGQVVDPFDILTVTPIQFRRNDDPDAIVTGFLAEDVEQKFPTAATYDDDGVLETVDERAILAALLAVVKDQAATIEDLRARIEALEA